MSSYELDKQVIGPTIQLAAQVKSMLDAPDAGEKVYHEVKVTWGTFYVSKIELSWSDGHDSEVVGVLVPDEGEGNTFDLFTVKPKEDE